MFPRRGRLLIGLFLLSFIIISYWSLLSLNDNNLNAELEERLEALKKKISGNEQVIKKIKKQLNQLREKDTTDYNGGKINKKQNTSNISPLKNGKMMIYEKEKKKYPFRKTEICPISNLTYNSAVDVQMLDVYEILPFDNPDGGVWKQGWNIEYDSTKIQQEKTLEVFVVPHSHNDPGWLKTFEEYYSEDVRDILNNMYKHLKLKSDLNFIYAEMSFFEMWWAEIDKEMRADVKKLVENGQLEIVTGGWVMTDEANSNYYAIIMELIEGHEFLRNQLDFIPKNHWSIDPFGLSCTMPYLLNRANFSNMAVNRVHYSVKKYLAQKKQLEFKWRQLFAHDNSTDIITNMFPFFSYDVPHTCGPDPKICCQFDFRRLKAFGCPWGKSPIVVTNKNVAERAFLLADQYRKKAQLYDTNTLLIPLGDDFRYNTDEEWTDQYANYRKLMDYINQKQEWNMKVQFGTLNDYFTMMQSRLEKKVKMNGHIPILTGDFFTYADRDDHYWSGYYTSRPFYKHMDRTLQHYLRSADILFSFACSQFGSDGTTSYDHLVEARRALSLFQHHDGVTGTGKAFVVQDYASKMLNAINKCKFIISNTTHQLMKRSSSLKNTLKIDEEHFSDALPQKKVIREKNFLILFNPLAQISEEVVCVNVKSEKTRIISEISSINIPQQIGPILYLNTDGNIQMHDDKFELCFIPTLPPMGFARYKIISNNDSSHKATVQTSMELSNSAFKAENINLSAQLCLSNSKLRACFNETTGLLKSIHTKSDETFVDLLFIRYNPRVRKTHESGDSLSGAYLFLPDGAADTLPADKNAFVIVKGPIRKYIFIKNNFHYKIQQIVKLDKNADYLSMDNWIDLSHSDHLHSKIIDVELAMRIKLLSATEDEFFTDLNNFQMIRRRRFHKLPIQAQFYPMSGAAFLENRQRRFTVLSRQALGVSSLTSGVLEIMLDRRLSSDDDRGMGEGVLDNKNTRSEFKLLFEPISKFYTSEKNRDKELVAYHSLAANRANLAMHYPTIVMIDETIDNNADPLPSSTSELNIGCDVHVVALRTTSEPTIYGRGIEEDPLRRTNPARSLALILHRLATDCRIENGSTHPSCQSTFGEIDLSKLFDKFQLKSIVNASLTLLHQSEENNNASKLHMQPMEFRTLLLNF